MKRHFILSMLCITWLQVSASAAADTTVLSNMRVEISPEQNNGLYVRGLFLTQTFDIMCTSEKEKIVLQQPHASILAQALWDHNPTRAAHIYHQWISTPQRRLKQTLSDLRFEVWIDDQTCTSYKYDVLNNMGQLTILVRGKGKHTIVLRYDFINNTNLPIYSMDIETRLAFFHFGGFLSDSWFFHSDNMRWGDIEVIVPDSLYFFADVPSRKQKNSCWLYPSSTKDFNIFFLNKNLYDPYTTRADYTSVTTYIQRAFQWDTLGNRTHITPRMSDSTLQQNLDNLRYWQTELELFFADSVQRDICFLERDFMIVLPGEHKVRMGTAWYDNPDANIIVCDKSFWRSPHVVHELTHLFMPCKHEENVHTLFGEAFVEYIATYIYERKDPNEMEKTFSFYYNRLSEEQKAQRVVGLEHKVGENEQVAYSRVPYILHQFAYRIGFERFMEILQGYFRYVRKENITMSLSNFEQFLTSHGISEEDWEWLMAHL